MRKKTLKIKTFYNFNYGYGLISDVYYNNSPVILDEIVKWSKTKKISIYNHFVRKEYEELSETKFYEVDGLKIPKCNYVIYLDIYYQNEVKK